MSLAPRKPTTSSLKRTHGDATAHKWNPTSPGSAVSDAVADRFELISEVESVQPGEPCTAARSTSETANRPIIAGISSMPPIRSVEPNV